MGIMTVHELHNAPTETLDAQDVLWADWVRGASRTHEVKLASRKPRTRMTATVAEIATQEKGKGRHRRPRPGWVGRVAGLVPIAALCVLAEQANVIEPGLSLFAMFVAGFTAALIVGW